MTDHRTRSRATARLRRPKPAALDRAGRAAIVAEATFNKCWHSHWVTVVPLESPDAWPVLDSFRGTIATYVFELGRAELGVAHAVDELYRRSATGESKVAHVDLDRFGAWYAKLKGALEVSIGHLFEHQGDTFNDMIDALPLAGRDVVGRALLSRPDNRRRAHGFARADEVVRAVRDLGGRWARFILHGENYVESTWEKVARARYLYRLFEGPWRDRHEDVTTWALHYDD